MSESRQLVAIANLTPLAVFASPSQADAIVEAIAKEVRAVETDISTPGGRREIASLAYKIARSKTAVDDMGKELVSEWKQKASVVDAERRRVWDALEALQAEIRKPLTDWEKADKARISAHEAALAEIERIGNFGQREDLQDIGTRIAVSAEIHKDRDWQEFAQRAAKARRTVGEKLDAAHKELIEAERAAEEVRKAEAERKERERQEREAAIAARAAEDAKREAEAKAEAERQAAERLAQEAAAAAAEQARREREAVETRAQEAEEARLTAERKAEADAAAARAEQERLESERQAAERRAAQAEADRLAAEDRARLNAQVAARKAEEAKQAAVEAERRRVAEEQSVAARAAEARERDRKHRAKVNGEAVNALVTFAALTEDQAKIVVASIARHEIPHTAISY